jgi:peptidoglycan/LPS O-acetylase OafA/YrhL
MIAQAWRASRDAVAALFAPAPTSGRRHYHLIDLLRGLAAYSVLLWHYQHFFADLPQQPAKSAYPLYAVLFPFYEWGGTAVQLFWLISGFIFSAVYAGSGVPARVFAVHRFARLYPLHLVTLLAVAALQFACLRTFGHSLIYEHNDPLDFLAQLFMASAWGLTDTLSFNAPIWSVSAEIAIYLAFWCVHRRLLRWGIALPLALALALAGMALFLWDDGPVQSCAFYFFCGCALYAAHRAWDGRLAWQLASASAALASAVAAFGLGSHAGGFLLLFAGLVMAAAALEATRAAGWARAVPWLADNTYGCYLWHVPLQLAAMLVLHQLKISREIALSAWFITLYVAIITVVARVSFLKIEHPLRRLITRGLAPASPRRGSLRPAPAAVV